MSTKRAREHHHKAMQDLGFVAAPEKQGLWRWKPMSAGDKQQGDGPVCLPKCWELMEGAQSLRHFRLDLSVRFDALRIHLSTSLKREFPNCTRVSHFTAEDESQWCLIEFPPREREAAKALGGIMGFRYQIAADRAHVVAMITDTMGIGDLPKNMVKLCVKWLTHSLVGHDLSLKKLWQPVSPLEARLPVSKLAAALVAQEPSQRKFLSKISVAHVSASTHVQSTELGLKLSFSEESTASHENLIRLKPTLSVLEARELVDILPNFEVQLSHDRSDDQAGFGGVRESFKQNSAEGLYTLRRQCMAGFIPSIDEIPIIERCLETEPKNLNLLSALIRFHLADGEPRNALVHLSTLLRELLDQFPELNEAPISDLVIPLHIGYCWEQSDWQKAKLSYERILEAIGEHPPILTRLAVLARQRQQKDLEKNYLSRLSLVERRRNRLSSVFLRLAHIAQEESADADSVLQLARRAVHHNPQSVQAAIFCSQLLRNQTDAAEAIEILSELDLNQQSISLDERKQIEQEMARVWSHQLGRDDLAEMKLLKFKNETQSAQAREALKLFYRDRHMNDRLVTVILESLDIAMSNADDELVRELWEEWRSVMIDEYEDTEKAEQMFLSLQEKKYIDTSSLEAASRWIISVDAWEQVIQVGQQQVFELDNADERRARLEFLASAAWKYLADDELAANLLSLALCEGKVREELVIQISDSLIAKKQYLQAAQLCYAYLKFVSDESYKCVALKVLSLPKGVSDSRADELTRHLFSLDPNDEVPLQTRLAYYLRQGDDQSFMIFYSSVLELMQTSIVKSYWIHEILNMHREFESRRSNEVIFNLYADLAEFSDNAGEVWTDGFDYFLREGASAQIEGAMRELLELHVLPDAEFRQFQNYFDEPSLLIGKYWLLRCQGEQGEQQIASLQRSLEQFNLCEDAKSLCFDVLILLSQLRCLDEELWNKALELAEYFGDAESLWMIQESQMVFGSQASEIANRWQDVVRFHREHAASREALTEALWRLYEDDGQDWQHIKSWYESHIEHHTEKACHIEKLEAILGHEECYLEPCMCLFAIKQLDEAGRQKTVTDAVDSIFCYFGEKESWVELAAIEGGVREMNLGGPVAAGWGFAMALFRQDFEALSYWVRKTLSFIEDVDTFDTYWGEVVNSTTLAQMDSALSLVEADIVAKTPLNDSLSVGWYESLVKIGLRYHHQGVSGNDGISALMIAMEQKSYDPRLWMPLYFMLRERADMQGMADHLRVILPQLVQNPEVLEKYPVTFESLRHDFSALKQGRYPQVSVPSMAVGQAYSSPRHVRGSDRTLGPERAATDEKPKLQGVNQEGAPLQAESALPHEFNSWRELLRENQFPEDLIKQIKDEAFASSLEKHVAVQTAAILCGRIHELKDWQWPVWSAPQSDYYSMEYKSRYPNDDGIQNIGSDLHKLIHSLQPGLIRVYRHRFGGQGLCQKLGLHRDMLANERLPLSWDDQAVGAGCFQRFQDGWQAKGFQLFTIQGLAGEVFFSPSDRAFYIDLTHWQSHPVSHLFHSVFYKVLSVESQYFIMLELDPIKEVLPFIVEVRQRLHRSSLGRIQDWFSGKKVTSAKAIESLNLDDCRMRMEKTGRFGEESLRQIWMDMRTHIHARMLSVTLDLVGMSEFFTGQPLMKIGKFSPRELPDSSPDVQAILHLAVKLKL